MNNDYFRAGNPKTSEAELRDIFASATPDVRLRLAENGHCPLDILARLSIDERPEVRAAAATNPSSTYAIVERVARDGSSEVRFVLASEPNLPVEILKLLSCDHDNAVRERARQTLTGMELEVKLSQSGFKKSVGDNARLGDLIVLAGILTEPEVNDFITRSRDAGLPLGRTLVESNALSQTLIVELLNVQTSIRNGFMSTEHAVALLQRYKMESISLRQTQQLQPIRPSSTTESHWSPEIRSLIDAAPDAVAVFDSAGTVIEWNRQAELMMGYARRQAVGQPIWQLLSSGLESQSNSLKGLFTPSSNGPTPVISMDTKDGRGGQIPVEITINRDDSENAPYIAFIRDVSERKKLEKRRSAQYGVTRLLSDSTSFNEAAAEIMQLLCDCTSWDAGGIYLVDESADVLRKAAWWKQSDALGGPEHDLFNRGSGIPGYVWKHKRPAWMDATSARRPESDGLQTAALGLPIIFQNEFHGVLYMTSTRMCIPERDSIEMLAICCAQIAQYLQRQKAEKERQRILLLQQREDFMATLAHDLKTPLISTERVLELLVNGSLGSLHPDQNRVLQMLRDSNQALLRMVKNLLAVYKYESGAEHLALESVDINKLMNTTVNEVRPMAETKQLEIQVGDDAKKQVDRVVCDGLELRRVFSNLLSNAVKFTPDNGRIAVWVEERHDEIAIHVKDNGIGIPQKEIKNVFSRFWQGDLCHRAIGTGLGLHLCKKIVEAHGGTIICESIVGMGTEFIVSLPKDLRANLVAKEEAQEDSGSIVYPDPLPVPQRQAARS